MLKCLLYNDIDINVLCVVSELYVGCVGDDLCLVFFLKKVN